MPLSSAASFRFGSLGVGVVGLLAGSVAHADALSVSSAQTTAVKTSAASNSSAGDVTVTSAGSIIVSDTGPAVTINSGNAVSNSGTISSSAATGATALLVDSSSGTIATTLTNNGTISVTGSDGSGNYGIRVIGSGVTGTIKGVSGSTVSVTGDGSKGVSIEAPFTGDVTLNSIVAAGTGSTAISLTAPLSGNLTLTGASSTGGADSTTLLVAAPVSGAVTNNGTMSTGFVATTTTDADGNSVTLDAAPGVAVVHIADSVGGGFLNNRYYTDSDGNVVADAAATSSDTLTTAAITGVSGTTAVLVSPLAATGSDITLSRVGTAGSDDGYGFVNRGAISTSSAVSGTSATAIRIAGASASGLTSHVILDTGLINQSNGTIAATVADATATAIAIGADATVPAIVNQGSIRATGSTTATTDTATARGIVIEAGANVSSIVNSGTIATSITGSGNAVATAITDLSGSLGSIVNSGTISATSASGTSSKLTAIDLSASDGDVTVTNTGTISGDILFGSGNSTYASTSGTLGGALSFGSGDNLLALDGTSSFANSLTLASGGTLAVSLAGTSSLSLSTTAPTLSSLTLSGQSQIALPVTASGSTTVTGAASFTGQSGIKLVVAEQVGSGTVTVLTTGSGLTTDHLSTLITGTSTPYLYTLTGYDVVDGDLQVTLHQKTGAEAGFAPGMAALFDQSLVAFGSGTTFQAVANLADQASLMSAYRQIAPPNYGTLPIRLAQSLTSTGAGVVRGRLDALAALPGGSDGAGRLVPWIQESVSLLRHRDADDDPGFSSDNFGLSMGVDYALSAHLAVGAAGTVAWDDVKVKGMESVSTKPFSVNSQMLDLYAGWHGGPFFVQAVGGYAKTQYDFHRQIDISTVSVTQLAQWKGHQLSGDLVAGARFAFGRFTVEPSDSLSYLKLRQNGYTTSGGGDLDLAVDGKSDKAATNSARLAVSYALPLGDDSSVRFGVRGGYVTQLDKSVTPLTAQFLGGGTSFDMASASLNGSAFQEGASLSYQMPGFYLGLSGDRRQESGYSDSSLQLTMRAAF